jgi:hypothetical protein
MNFDDLKSAWNKDSSSDITIPNTIEELKRAELPLDKIKRNMKREFVVQALSVVFIGFVPEIYKLKPALLLPFNIIYMLFVVTCIYFFARFYSFYKRIGAASLTTKDALYEVNYDVRLNMELYKMFSYMLFPFVLMMVALILVNTKYNQIGQLLQSGPTNSVYLYVALTVITIYVFLHFATVYWLKTYYLNYAKEIERILKALKEEE